MTRRLIAEFAVRSAPAPRPAPEGLAALTPCEREVLAHDGRGLSNAETADRLQSAEGAGKTHVSLLPGEPEPRSRLQAAVPAEELGISPIRRPTSARVVQTY
ncbi:hypothetical protein [Streptomyces sennicomposti]